MADYKEIAKVTKKLVQAFAADRSRENMVKLMEHIELTKVFVPVETVGMTDEMKALAKKQGKVEISGDVKIRNRLLVSGQGDTVMPVFTSPEEITNAELKEQFVLMSFIDCAKAATVENSGVKAIIVNPFTDNVGIVDKLLEACVQRREAIDNAMKQNQSAQPKQVKMTEKQFHQIARAQTETLTIVKQFFEKKGAFLEELNERREDVFMDAYKAFYADQLPIPFDKSEIKIFVIGVSADTKLALVDLPSGKNMQSGMCSKVFLSYDASKDEAHYLVIQKNNDTFEFAEFDKEGKRTVIGDAPDEGTEMNAVMKYLGME